MRLRVAAAEVQSATEEINGKRQMANAASLAARKLNEIESDRVGSVGWLEEGGRLIQFSSIKHEKRG